MKSERIKKWNKRLIWKYLSSVLFKFARKFSTKILIEGKIHGITDNGIKNKCEKIQ